MLNIIGAGTKKGEVTQDALAVLRAADAVFVRTASHPSAEGLKEAGIAFETLDVGSALTLSAKNGDISGAVAGSYDDFSIQTEIKKGESNLPGDKDDGEKALRVSCNNGDVDIAFANGN